MNTLNLHNLSSKEIQTTLETYMWEARMKRVEEFKEQDKNTGSFGFSYGETCAIPQIEIEGTDDKFSVQASESNYCSPRESMQEVYDEVEIGFPNFIFSEEFINQYAEDRDTTKDTVYAYVPMKELAQEIYNLLNGKI